MGIDLQFKLHCMYVICKVILNSIKLVAMFIMIEVSKNKWDTSYFFIRHDT